MNSPYAKLVLLLTPEQRRSALRLLGLMVIGMVLETLGIGLVIPALALMTDNAPVAKLTTYMPSLHVLSTVSHDQLVIGGMLVLVAAYAVKAVFLGILAWRQSHFVFGLQAHMSERLYAGYMRQPYRFHLQRNSAQLIRNILTQVSDLANVVGQLLIFVTETLVLIGIASLLLVLEPVGAIIVGVVLGVAGALFNYVTRRRIRSWGEARQYHEGLRIQHLQQGLGGVKDVKLLGRERDFLEQYSYHNAGSARVGLLQITFQALPRLWLELLAVTALATLVLAMIWQGKPITALLPTLGLFAAAAFRVMPSVTRVLTAVQAVRFSSPVIDTLESELALLDGNVLPERGAPMPFDDRLTLDNIGFQYETADRPALHEVSLMIPRGTTCGFIGGSGAGKSTLVDIILGLLAPDSGVVRVDGTDIQTNLRRWQDKIGYVPQSIFLTDDTLRRNIAFGLPNEQIDEAAVWRALRAAQLEDFVTDELTDGLATVVGERGIRLSGGQRQRIGIARALYHDPAVLVLDEATSSLDMVTERGVMDAVRALHGDKTIIIVAHRLSTVEHCDRLFRLSQGRLVEEGDAVAVLGGISADG